MYNPLNVKTPRLLFSHKSVERLGTALTLSEAVCNSLTAKQRRIGTPRKVAIRQVVEGFICAACKDNRHSSCVSDRCECGRKH